MHDATPVGVAPSVHDLIVNAIDELDIAVTALHGEHNPCDPARSDIDAALLLLHNARRQRATP